MSHLVSAAAITALVVLAQGHQVPLPSRRAVSLRDAVLFAGALMLPLGHALLAATAGSLLADAWRRSGAARTARSAVAAGLPVALAALTFRFLAPETEGMGIGLPWLGRAALAGGVFHVSSLALAVATAWSKKNPGPKGSLYGWWAAEAPAQAAVLTLGCLAAFLVEQAWWWGLLLGGPLLLAYVIAYRAAWEARRVSEEVQLRALSMEAWRLVLRRRTESARASAQEALAAGLAHEVNNPLFAILGRTELLLRDPGRHLRGQASQEHLREIHDLAQQVADTVRDLADGAEVETAGPRARR